MLHTLFGAATELIRDLEYLKVKLTQKHTKLMKILTMLIYLFMLI